MRGSFIQNLLRFLASNTSLEVRLFHWLISREKIKAVHVDSIVEQTVIFEVGLSRNNPDASP